MSTQNAEITILIPSFRDCRILHAIDSVVAFDDVGAVSILVIDGGSDEELLTSMWDRLRPSDRLLSAPDKGIFDGLNKGLALIDTPYMGWLGSDDWFSGIVPASEILGLLARNDLVVGDIEFVSDGRVTRKTFGWPSSVGLWRLGLHNPHYATFGSTELLKSERFDLSLLGADIAYFNRIYLKADGVVPLNRTVTYQGEFGFSNQSASRILRTNIELVPIFGLLGPLAIPVKLVYKFCSRLYYRLVDKRPINSAT